MIKPQLETDVLLKRLLPSLGDASILLSEFEIQTIIHKARRIPDRHEGLSVEGLAYIIMGNVEKGSELCERSISLDTTDHVAWLNYALALASRGHHSQQRQVLQKALTHQITEVFLSALITSCFWVDEIMFARCYNALRPTGLIEKALSESEAREVDFMLKIFPCTNLISPFSQVAFEVADAERLIVSTSQVFGDSEDGFCFSLGVRNIDSERLIELNNKIIEKIIDKNLLDIDCTAIITAEGN